MIDTAHSQQYSCGTEPLLPENHSSDTATEGTDTSAPRSVPLWRLFRYADRWDVVLLTLGVVAALILPAGWAAMAIFWGVLTQGMVEFGRNSTAPDAASNLTDAVDEFSIGIGSCVAGIFITCFISAFCFNYSASRQVRRIKKLFLNSALRQQMSWFDAQKMGDFASRISDDARKLEDGLNEKLSIIIICTVLFFQGVGISFYYGWRLSLALSGIVPPLFCATLFMSKLQGTQAELETASYSAAGSIATEAFSAIRTVAAFGAEKHETERYRESLRPAQSAMIRRGLLNGFGTGLVEQVVCVAFGVAFWYGTKLVLESREAGNDQYTAGNVSIVFFSLLFGTLALGDLGPYTEALATAKGAAATIFDVIEQKSALDPLSPEGEKPDDLEGHIEFRDVSFSYPSRPDVPVLKSISFSVRPGQTVALVGSSGCGKTTCVQLVQRLYDPDHGRVLLDGRDLTLLNLSWLRRQIGVVSQEPVLFSGTVAENIRHGCPEATDEEVEQAAREANAWEVIERLPLGLETPLGAGGAQLSGGQRQRVAIARALVRRPSILLLDEATAALDVHSEATVLQALEKARAGRTTIIIAHRLSTVRSADVIHVIDGGQLIESGSHRQLMLAAGVYHRLVTAQNLTAEDEEEEEEESTEDNDGEEVRQAESRRRRLSSAVSHDEHQETGSDQTEQRSDTDDPSALAPVSRRRLLAGNRAEWPYITLGVVASVFLGLSSPGFAVIYSSMLKNFSEPDPAVATSMSVIWAFAISGLGATLFIAYTLQTWAFSVSGERLTTRLRVGLFSSLLHQEMSFHDQTKHSVGALTSWLSEDASKVQAASGIRLGQLSKALFSLLAGASLSFWLSWRVALAVIAFVPVSAFCAAIEHKLNGSREEEERAEHQHANQVAVEALSNIRTVAAYGMEEEISRRFQDILDGGRRRQLKRSLTRGFMVAFSEAVPQIDNVVLFQVGRLELLSGRTTYPVLFMISETLLFAVTQMSSSFLFSEDFSSALIAARRVFAMIDRQPTIDPRKPGVDPREPGVDTCKPGVDPREPGIDSREPGVDPREPGIDSREPGVDSRQPTIAPLELGLDSQHVAVNCQVVVDSRQPVVGSEQYFVDTRVNFLGPGRHAQPKRGDSSDHTYHKRRAVSTKVGSDDWLTDEDPRVIAAVNGGFVDSECQQRLNSEETYTNLHSEGSENSVDNSFVSDKSIEQIAMRGVTFRYPSRPQVTVLRDLDLEVTPGQTVALVGASGCGKSTCVQLLQRFYDPDTGEVCVDGRCLARADLRAHRANIGVVSQEPVLFNRTIRENIAYGDTSREVRMDEVMAAARAANIHQFVTSLPAGYDTQLGSSSRSQLSGGQKQRIAIARALLRRPALLLLDEATSALDTESEKCVQEALDRAASGRTCLVIAHRLSTIQSADRILVMHRGRVVEQGTHQQLLALRGRYFGMCSAAN